MLRRSPRILTITNTLPSGGIRVTKMGKTDYYARGRQFRSYFNKYCDLETDARGFTQQDLDWMDEHCPWDEDEPYPIPSEWDSKTSTKARSSMTSSRSHWRSFMMINHGTIKGKEVVREKKDGSGGDGKDVITEEMSSMPGILEKEASLETTAITNQLEGLSVTEPQDTSQSDEVRDYTPTNTALTFPKLKPLPPPANSAPSTPNPPASLPAKPIQAPHLPPPISQIPTAQHQLFGAWTFPSSSSSNAPEPQPQERVDQRTTESITEMLDQVLENGGRIPHELSGALHQYYVEQRRARSIARGREAKGKDV